MYSHLQQYPAELSKRILALLLCLSLIFPPSVAFGAGGLSDADITRIESRLNSPERAKAIADAARQTELEKNATPAADAAPLPGGNVAVATATPIPASPSISRNIPSAAGPTPATSMPKSRAEVSKSVPGAPKSMTEVLFNTTVGVAGLPGLNPVPPQKDAAFNINSPAGSGSTTDPGWTQGGVLPSGAPRTMMKEHGPPRRDSSPYSDPDVFTLDKGINYGLGLLNIYGQSLAGSVDGNLRLQFYSDQDGKLQGEGDFLLPLYDTTHMSLFMQTGLRSMWDDRWIGNIGIGQRWYPAAQEKDGLIDSGKWMLGYNAFFDYDLTRTHQRGGLGVEAQHDWIKLSANYYTPLSGWRDAKGSDKDLKDYLERPAEGWDARIRGYLPFYRNIALTGAYSQWRGEEVGVFSSSKREKNPGVWSYGIEYTPFPLLTASIEQRRTENGQADTQYGLRFTYAFGSSFEDNFDSAKVHESRKNSLNRRDFVDREYKIILAYKKKPQKQQQYLSIDLDQYYFSAPSASLLRISLFADTSSPLTQVLWGGPAAQFIVAEGLNGVTLRLPVYNSAPDADNSYQIWAVAQNADGQNATSAVATVVVTPPESGYILTESAPSPVVPIGGSTTITALLRSLTGQPIVGENVLWSIVSGPGSLDVPNSGTNAAGEALNTYTATAPGTVVIRATLASDPTAQAEITLTVPHLYSLQLQPAATHVTSGDPLGLTATLLDNGVPVDNANLTWNIVPLSGSGSIATASSLTDPAGQSPNTLTGAHPGLVTVVARLASNASITASATITVDPLLPDNFALAVNQPSPINAGGSGPVVATLTNNSVVVPDAQITWSIVGGTSTGTLSTLTSNTNSSGDAQTILTAGLHGTVAIQATYNGVVVSNIITVSVGAAYSLSLSSDASSISNGGTANLTATLLDGGIPVSGVPLAWSVSGTGNGTVSPTSTTTASGVGANIFTATQSGSVTVTVTYSGVSAQVAIAITPVYQLTWSASPGPGPFTINNGASQAFNVTLTDNGTPVPGAAIAWSFDATGNGTLPASTTTNASGQASNTFTATASGTVTVTATFGTLTQSAVITINPVYSLSLSASASSINNGGSANLTATLLDGTNPVPSAAITWSVSSGPGNGTFSSSPTSTTNASGVATNIFTANADGTATIQATYGTTTAQVTILISPSYALTLTPGSQSISNGGPAPLTATLTDNGVPVNGATITWSFSGTGGGTLPASSTTDGSGNAANTFTATASGTVTVTVTYSGASAQATITITPSYSLSLTPATATISNGSGILLTATLLDGANPVPGTNITWSLSPGSPGNGGLNVATSATNASGQASNTFTANTSGTVTVTATFGTLTQTATITITPVYSLRLNPATQTIALGGSGANLTATLLDGTNPVPGASITWALTGAGTLPPTSPLTYASGNTVNTFTPTVSGLVTVTATFTPASGPSISAQAQIDINDSYALNLSAAPNSISNLGTSTLTATLTNGGVVVNGAAITWSIVSGPGGGSLSSSSSTTNTSGQAVNTFTANTSGTVTIQAQYGTIIAQATITIIPAYHIALNPHEQTIVNGGSASLTATLLDGNNPVPGATLSWYLVGNGSMLAASTATDSNGNSVNTFTATASGLASITIAYGGAGALAEVDVDPLYSLNLTAVPTTINNGGQTTLTATLTDNGAPVSGQSISWSIIGGTGSGSLSSSSSTTNSGGNAGNTLTATQSGTIIVQALFTTVTPSGMPVTLTAQNTIVVNPVYALTLSPPSPSINDGSSQIFTATLTDNGTPVSGMQINWTATPGTGNGSLSGASSLTGSNGQTTNTFTASASGTVVVTASVNGSPAVSAQATVTILPVYALSLTASPSVISLSGGSSVFTATLTDNGNPVSGAPIAWSIVGGTGGGSLSSLSSTTSGTGQATNTLTPTASGTITVQASFGGISQTATITITPSYALSITPGAVSVLDGSNTPLTVTLTNNGVAVSGQTISWTITPGTGNGSLSSPSSTTDGSGNAVNTFTASQSGTVTVTATFTPVGSPIVSAQSTITINDSYSLSLTALSSVISNGGSTGLTATLLNGGLPASGTITWSIVSGGTGNGSLSSSSSATDGGGNAVNTFTATRSGTVIIRATFTPPGGGSISAQTTITVTPVYALTLTPMTQSMNNGANQAFTVTLTDNGTPVSGAAVDWSVTPGSPGNGNLSQTSSATNSAGQAAVIFTATQSGTAGLTATFGALTQTATITINPVYTLSVVAASATISNDGSTTLTATLLDNGAVVNGQTIDWSFTGAGNGSLANASSTTAGAGQAPNTFTASVSGTVTVTAALNGAPGVNAQTTITINPLYTISLAAVPSTILNGDSSALTATLMDGTNPVPGALINFGVVTNDTGNGDVAATSTTNASGQAPNTFTATSSGTADVIAYFTGTLSSGPVTVSARTTLTINTNYDLIVFASPSSIPNGDGSTLTAILVDGANPVPGAFISWSVASGAPGNGTLDVSGTSTNASGQTSNTFTATQSGTVTVTAQAFFGAVTGTASITITPSYSLSLTPAAQTIANNNSESVTATLMDGANPVSGAAIAWSLIPGSPGNGSLPSTSPLTDASGNTVNTFTATASGTVIITASYAGLTAQATITINDSYALSLSAAPASILNGTTSTLTATLTNNSSPVSSASLSWSFSGSGNGSLAATSSTDGAGNSTNIFTATQSGTVTVTVIYTPPSGPSISAQTTITITPVYTLTVAPPLSTINTDGSVVLTATLLDNGVPVPGANIAWYLTGAGIFSTASPSTNASGQTSNTFTATVSGNQTITLAYANVGAIASIDVEPLYSLSLTASPTTIINGSPTALTATLLDNGNPVSGQSISWSIVGGTGSGTLGTAFSVTNSSGQAQNALAATASGTVVVQALFSTVTPGGIPVTLTAQTTVTVTPNYVLTLSPLNQSMSNGSTLPFTATLTDNGTTLISGAQINWSVTPGTGNGSLSASNSLTNGSGQATSTLTATRSGGLTLTATLASNPAISVSTTVVVTPVYALSVNAVPSSINNGGTSTVTATLTDNGVPVNGASIVWSITGGTGNGTFSSSSSATNASGNATTTFTASRSGTVIVQATFSTATAQTTITINPVYALVLSPLNPSMGNGSTLAFTATLTDNGIPVNGAAINWSVTPGTGNGSLSTSSSSTNSSGQATSTLTATQSGTLTLTATLASSPTISVSTTVTVTPAYHLSISATPSSINNGANSALTATLLDGTNPVNGATITWSVSGTGNGTFSPTSSTTDASGNATTTFTATRSGTVTVQAAFGGTTAQTSITITPVYALVISPNNSPTVISDGNGQTFTATLTDNGTPVNGMQINWTFTPGAPGNGNLNTSSTATNTSGQGAVTFTATQSGTGTLTATLATAPGITASAPLLITPSYTLSVSAAPSSILNGGTSTLTATLMDSANPVNGATIAWSIFSGPGVGTLVPASSTTGATGQATTTFAATVSGTVTVQATFTYIDNNGVTQNLTAQTTLTVTPNYVLTLTTSQPNLNLSSTAPFIVNLVDSNGVTSVPAPGVQINWSVTAGTGNGSLSASSVVTDIDGNAATALTGTRAGTLTLTAALASNPGISVSTTVTIDNTGYSLTLSPWTPTVSITKWTTFTATLLLNGGEVHGALINWAIVGGTGSGTLSPTSTTTIGNGTATVNIYPSALGTVIVQATLASDPSVSLTAVITVTP